MLRPWLICACVAFSACSESPPPSPSPSPSPGGEAITGSERIGWDQRAATALELGSFRYLIYVDNVSSELADVACGPAAGPSGFSCSARLPPLSAGTHLLSLAAFVESGSRLESVRSAPLSVTVSPPRTAAAAPRPDALRFTTSDGVALRAVVIAEGINAPTDLAFAPDGRIYIAQRDGRILVVRDGRLQDRPAVTIDEAVADERKGLLALTIDPDFASNGFLYAVYSSDAGFRLSRFRAVGETLGDRVTLLDGMPASPSRPAASLRFGPDRKLYLAVDDGGVATRAGDLGSFSGKILRLNADATTPRDQPGGTPVFALHRWAPRGVAWGVSSTTLWVLDGSSGSTDELHVLDPASGRGVVVGRYRLTPGTGATSIAAYRGRLIPAFSGDLLVAAENARALLRLRVDADDGRRLANTEYLLRDAVGPIQVVAVDAAGAIVIAANSMLIRIAPEI